jgi:hypothetical protein
MRGNNKYDDCNRVMMSPLSKHGPNIFGQNQNTSVIMMLAGAHSFLVNSSRVLQSVQILSYLAAVKVQEDMRKAIYIKIWI